MKIDNFEATQNKPKLLLHVCCAPCLCGVIDRVIDKFDVTLFFYNPNIMPNAEFDKRLSALKEMLTHYLGTKLIVPDQNEQEFLAVANGLENEKEGGARCTKCFELRLSKTAEYLSNHTDEYDYFATTLTVSPHKNAPLINKIGNEIAEKFGVKYLESDFKKQNGFLLSTTLSKELGIYRQDYCGCEFSNWHKQ